MDNYFKWQKFVIITFILLFVATLIYGLVSLFTPKYGFVLIFTSSLGITLLLIPIIINEYTKYTISFYAFLFYAILIVLTMLLGFIFKLYTIFPSYDIITHSLSHILLTLLGIVLINKILKVNKFTNPIIIVFCGIVFALACGFVWELIEFSLDSIFGLNMQRFIPEEIVLYNGGNSFENLKGTDFEIANYFRIPSGYRYALLDTMYDLFVDLIGAIVGGVIFLLCSNNLKKKILRSINYKSTNIKVCCYEYV